MPLDRLGIGKLTLPYGMDNDLRIALEEFATRVDDNMNYVLPAVISSIGPQGPVGPQGPAGADGLDGLQLSGGDITGNLNVSGTVGIGTTSPDEKLQVVGTVKVGEDTTNYTKFESDGTMQAVGNATCFRDELNDLIKSASQNPSSHLVYDYTEGTLDFKNNCDLNDWALMNVQINHDWKLGSAVEPHIHWFQNANNTPNWLIQYRWQKQGNTKTTTWTSAKWSSNAITYSSGTINQITAFGSISAPSGYGEVSDILQIRLLRDTANASTLFAGADPYTGDAEAVSFDVHIEIDMLGSRSLYSKD